MKYFGYMPNDFINGKGVCVSLWTAGCPHKCPGCHNEHMWKYENGYEVPVDMKEKLTAAITANGVTRNFSVLGGEPLAKYNLEFVDDIVTYVRNQFPHIKIFLWTGYEYKKLSKSRNKHIKSILSQVDILIDGPYIDSQRDITLDLRGSSNQNIIELKGEHNG